MSGKGSDTPVTARVDDQLRQFLDEQANTHGITRAELLRRLISFYHDAQHDRVSCPACEELLQLEAPMNPTPSDQQQSTTGPQSEEIHTQDITVEYLDQDESLDTILQQLHRHSNETQTVARDVQQLHQDVETLREQLQQFEADIQRIDALENQITAAERELKTELSAVHQRVESLTELSKIDNETTCRNCGGNLHVQSYITEPSTIACEDCDTVIDQLR